MRLQIFRSLWADFKCWWLCVFFFLHSYLFIPPWVCVSCCTVRCLWSWNLLIFGICHTHTHTLKMKSNDSRVLTVVFLDLRRVTLHTAGEREGGKCPVFSEEQWSSYHRGRGRDCLIRDERWLDPQRVKERKGMKGLGAPQFVFYASWFWFMQQCHTFQMTITSASLLSVYLFLFRCWFYQSDIVTHFGHTNIKKFPREVRLSRSHSKDFGLWLCERLIGVF